jgi:RNA polymerase sigma factor (sigma-70 family)
LNTFIARYPMQTKAADATQDANTDLALARRIAQRDSAAFELLMRRHNRRLFRLAQATLGNAAEAEDALQDAYLHAYRSIALFRGDAALSTWLSRLVLNECLARRRRDLRRQNIVPLVSAEDNMNIVRGVADDSASPDRELGQLQLRTLLERKANELPQAFRQVWMLRSVEEMDVAQVAHILDIPEETVRSRHFRARTLLRESLARDVDLQERNLFEFAGARCDAVVAKVLARIVDDPNAEPDDAPVECSSPPCFGRDFSS